MYRTIRVPVPVPVPVPDGPGILELVCAMAEDFFAAEPPPTWLNEARKKMDAFVSKMEGLVACVTSGGTTVPLERNTVRFIDNFSTGNRGAASAEQLLAQGYAVIFLHREHSAFPFARKRMPPAKSAKEWLQSKDTEGELEDKRSYALQASRFLALPFTTISEYLHLLRAAACALNAAGPNAIIVLAAAVSDFYIPHDQMVEHKIQSSVTTSEHVQGGLVLKLWPVPKLLGSIKHSAASWAPSAFVVGFKLETNRWAHQTSNCR